MNKFIKGTLGVILSLLLLSLISASNVFADFPAPPPPPPTSSGSGG